MNGLSLKDFLARLLCSLLALLDGMGLGCMDNTSLTARGCSNRPLRLSCRLRGGLRLLGFFLKNH